MIIIELRGAEKAEFGQSILSVDDTKLRVKAKYQDRQDVIDTYPLVNVLRYREVPDQQA